MLTPDGGLQSQGSISEWKREAKQRSRLVFRLCQDYLQINKIKTNMWENEQNIWSSNSQWKTGRAYKKGKHLTPLIDKEINIKTMMRHHSHQVDNSIKNLVMSNDGE